MSHTRSLVIHRAATGQPTEAGQDEVVVEEPLEIRLRSQPLAVLMRTPGHDEELACGFVVTEGIVPGLLDPRFATHCRQAPPPLGQNIIHVHVPDRLELDLEGLRRNIYASSSCGICGKATLDALVVRAPPPKLTRPIEPETIHRAMALMQERQPLFEATGGLHAAGLYNLRTQKLLAVREDVGRHNAVDKIVGRQILRRALPLKDHLLVVSGRVGFEIAQKALVAGIPALAAVSAPSSLAVDVALRSGMLLVGFVRAGRMNVYASAAHLEPGAAPAPDSG